MTGSTRGKHGSEEKNQQEENQQEASAQQAHRAILEEIKMQGHIDIEGVSSGWVRFCIGAAILMLSAAPLLHVVRWW